MFYTCAVKEILRKQSCFYKDKCNHSQLVLKNSQTVSLMKFLGDDIICRRLLTGGIKIDVRYIWTYMDASLLYLTELDIILNQWVVLMFMIY